ncbi:MAG: DegT/DnrJ/EryC1/StrS family aminotransferase [bacterium]|nr:DegT/DnrJ/EryC1/StrS family aminotransferase [bacterium]
MSIPFLDLQAQHAQVGDALCEAMQRVMKKTWFIFGEELEAFEAEFAAYCNAKNCIGVGSGTDALYLALKACNIGPGDEVITVSHTFIATALAISWTGATPVFVDIDDATYTLDTSVVSQAITERTRAILPVHLYGQCVDMDPLMDLARQHDLWVIEDAAQAHGASYKGRTAGSMGHLGCVSFYPSKNLGACGDGGAVITNDTDLAERLRLLRNYGQTEKYHHSIQGYNSRLGELQAAVLRVKLGYLDQWNESRQALAARYNELLAGQIQTPQVREGNSHVYYLYVVEVENRDRVQHLMQEKGIDTLIHYPIPVHRQEAYRGENRFRQSGSLAVTERVSQRILSLPLYPELEPIQLESIVEAVLESVTHEH